MANLKPLLDLLLNLLFDLLDLLLNLLFDLLDLKKAPI